MNAQPGQRIIGRDVAPNSDGPTPASPFGAQTTRTVYKVKRTGNTDIATGKPLLELYCGSDMIARLLIGKPEHLAWIELINKSIPARAELLESGESYELYPRLKVTIQASNERRFPCAMTPVASMTDEERSANIRQRGIFACQKQAAERHVASHDARRIISEYITSREPGKEDIDGAHEAINALWKAEGHSFIPETDPVEDKPVNDHDEQAAYEESNAAIGLAEQEAAINESEDLDKIFHPKTTTRAPWGAEGNNVAAKDITFSVRSHFERELKNLAPALTLGKELNIALDGIDLDTLLKKRGLKVTIDYLQTHLDLLADQQGKPATSKTAPVTPSKPSEPIARPTTPEIANRPVSADAPRSDVVDKAEFRKERMIAVGTSKPNYLKAGDRVVLFRADHPDWTIETEAIQCLPDFAVFKASIKDASGRRVATAHGFCTPDLAKKVSGRFIEKAETAAIARALALAGYGSDDTLDDSDYLSDSPVAA